MSWLFQSDGQWQWPWPASAENTCLGGFAHMLLNYLQNTDQDVCNVQCKWMQICTHMCECMHGILHRHSGQAVLKTCQLRDLVFQDMHQNCRAPHRIVIVLFHNIQYLLCAISHMIHGTIASKSKHLLCCSPPLLRLARHGALNLENEIWLLQLERHFYLFRQSQ